MFKAKLYKVVAGFVLAAVLMVPASVAEEIPSGAGWPLESLWRVWAELVSAFGLGEDPPLDGGEKGPAIDPAGAGSETEEDKGPRIDPRGLTSESRGEVGARIDPAGLASEPEGEVGPAIDPAGLSSEPEGEVDPRIDPRG